MKTSKQKKAGFTLVELMVVAIIVAILAAVAIPLMTGNKDRAMATEAQAGCTTIATQIRMYYAEKGDAAATPTLANLTGIRAGDLNGTYFDTYTINSASKSAQGVSYQITATGKGDALGKNVVMNTVNGVTTWAGNLLIPTP